jgi:hypothetical protein
VRRWQRDAIVLVGYVAVSFAFYGWRLWPHPGRPLLGFGPDAEIFVWSFAWWPHALGSGTNPFVTHAIYVPTGMNMAWITSVPVLALAFAPLTVLFGPAVAYNVAWLVLPALAAWTAYLLCRALTGSAWAALVGGYLFGFSSFVLGHELAGHFNLTGVFLLPLEVLVLVRFVRSELGGRGLAWRLGALLALQIGISTEVAVTTTVVLVLGWLLALALVSDSRPRLRAAVVPVAGAYAVAALLAAPFVAYMLSGFVPHGFWDPATYDADLLNLVVPTKLTALGGSSLESVSSRFAGADNERGLYLGLPALLMILLLAVRWRRSPAVRWLVAMLVLGTLLAAGTALHVDGRRLVALPWALAVHLPVLDHVAPMRMTVYVSLAAAVAVALWIAWTPGRLYPRPYVLPALAIVSVLPALWHFPTFGAERPTRPAFFAQRLDETCLRPGETIAVLPLGGDSLVWQAESGFRFRLAGNGLQPYSAKVASNDFDADPIVHALTWVDYARPTMDTLLAFAALHGVDRFVVVSGSGYPTAAQLGRIGPVQRAGGLLVAPACGRPGLGARDLSGYVERYRAGAHDVGYCTGGSFTTVPSSLYPSGPLAGASRAIFVEGRGLTCPPAPAGYVRRGFATAAMNVPPGTYAYYVPVSPSA